MHADELPRGWIPATCPLPDWTGPSLETFNAGPTGFYAQVDVDGEVRFAWGALAGRCLSMMRLWKGRQRGCANANELAETWNDGITESFNAWDDDSPPFPATETFEVWSRLAARDVAMHQRAMARHHLGAVPPLEFNAGWEQRLFMERGLRRMMSLND